MTLSREHVVSLAGWLRPVRHRTGTLLPILLLCLLASAAAAQDAAPAADGTLVEQTPCPPDTATYESTSK